MSQTEPNGPRFAIVKESLPTKTLLVIDTHGEGEQVPQELRALVSSKAITQIELAEVRAQLENFMRVATIRGNMEILKLLPTEGVDISEKHDWQNIPQKDHFMFSDGRWALIIETMPNELDSPALNQWQIGPSLTLVVVFQGEETPSQIDVATYHRFEDGPEYKSVLAETPKSVCKFVEPSRLKTVGITIPGK